MKNNRQPISFSKNQDSTWVFGLNIKNEKLKIDSNISWTSTANWTLNTTPLKTHFLQVSWDKSKIENRAEQPHSKSTKIVKLTNKKSQEISAEFDEGDEKSTLVEHDLIKKFTLESQVLSEWWGKSTSINAAVLLPSGYADHPKKKYPVC